MVKWDRLMSDRIQFVQGGIKDLCCNVSIPMNNWKENFDCISFRTMHNSLVLLVSGRK